MEIAVRRVLYLVLIRLGKNKRDFIAADLTKAPVKDGNVPAGPYPAVLVDAFSGNRSGCSIDSIPKSTSNSGQ